ncbi:V-type ATP synthase subunit F [candidate division WOR-3 bacterium]|nr:V-type ATP synthase subunit F [candidate division WOR-3 bacterium]
MEGKMAIIGREDQILPFSAIGIEIFPVEKAEQANKLLLSLAEKKYALVMITEDFALDVLSTRMKFASEAIPAIIAVPGSEGVTGSTLHQLRETLKHAVGADILSEK